MAETKPEVIYCPQCGKANEPDRQQCIQCGTQLVTTLAIDETVVPAAPPGLRAAASNISGQLGTTGTIVLSVAGYDHPIYVRRQPEIWLGRAAPGEPPPTVDLGPFRGQHMGVSRRHAVIRFGPDACTIEDMGSANGTWLNENRLAPRQPHPMHAGDYVRLGHLIIVVQASDIDTLLLRETNPERLATDEVPRLTPYDLVHHLGPYLNALTTLQHLTKEIAGQKPDMVSIHRITVQKSGILQIWVSGLTETLGFLSDRLLPWRKRYSDLLLQAQKLSSASGQVLTTQTTDEALRPQLNNAFELLEQTAMASLIGGHDTEKVEAVRPRVREALQPLAFSSLLVIEKPVTGGLTSAGPGIDPSSTRSLQ